MESKERLRMEIIKKKFGEIDGSAVTAYTVKGNGGFELTCLDYGCVITEIFVPGQDGKSENIVLGFKEIEDYASHSPYFGAIVGRVAGRIKEGRFSLGGQDYSLAKNNDDNHLHGGVRGLDKVIWNVETKTDHDKVKLIFTYESPDGEEGYPGNVSIRTVYTVTGQNELEIEYFGTTDKKTILNLTNHTYFNLSGNLKSTILEHTLQIDSDRFLELDSCFIPTGRLLDVEGTPFDFREGKKIAEGQASSHQQNVLVGKGYDHPLVLNGDKQPAIRVSCEESGRVLEVETNQPAVILYTSNQLEGDFLINGNVKAEPYLALCLETQKHPDAINQPGFPSVVLDPDGEYYSYTKYTFKTE